MFTLVSHMHPMHADTTYRPALAAFTLLHCCRPSNQHQALTLTATLMAHANYKPHRRPAGMRRLKLSVLIILLLLYMAPICQLLLLPAPGSCPGVPTLKTYTAEAAASLHC